jgi:ribosome maturation factor RimP
MALGLEKIREIAGRVAASDGLELWDIELKGSGAARTLRIFIDRPEGVSHQDCAAFSREVSTIFDVEDAIPGGSYILEVSSPGLDRRLLRPEHYARFSGSLIRFSLRQPREGNRHFEGRLTAASGGEITVDLDQAASRKKAKAQGSGEIKVSITEIEKANLVPEF